MTNKRGHLIVISGPAGVGKGTLRKRLFDAIPDLVYSVSCTTRSPREGEVDGRDYFFISRDNFKTLISEDAFLEWADVHGNLYGTRASDVERAIASGASLVLEIDVQGAANVRRRIPEAIGIFIMPPSIDELKSRLVGRGSETDETLERRMADALGEIERADEYEHKVVNDDLDRASEEMVEIVRGILEVR